MSTSRRATKASSRQARRLNKKLHIPQTSTTVRNTQKDEFYARFLNGDPEQKLTCSEILEIYEHSLAKLEASMKKVNLR